MNKRVSSLLFLLILEAMFLINTGFGAANNPRASAEVTAAMQPFLDSYKLAGAIGIIADKNGRVHYRNLLGYADVEAKKTISNRVHRFPEAGGGLFSTTHDIRR